MQKTRSKIQYLPATILMVVGMFMWVLSCGGIATALDIDFNFHDDSAHGNISYGVNRSGTGYLRGDCLHCHDSFDEFICGVKPLMLFSERNPDSQTGNFCFQCHKSDGAVQQVTNYDYGATFGGGTPMFTSIYDAFNPTGTYASAHDLATVKDWVKKRGWGSWMTDDTNACLICHDPHVSQKNFPVEYSGYGGVKTAIRKSNWIQNLGSGADDKFLLWGDESVAAGNTKEIISERWQTAVVYQAPLRGDSGYEPGPAGSSTSDGSNLPDFVWFCAHTCHRRGSVPDVEKVNWYHKDQTGKSNPVWTGDPSAHGRLAANGGGFGVLKAPYSEGQRGKYMLSCTDCHEPHGSTNHRLLRTTVNGVSGLDTGGPGTSPNCRWTYFCEACHEIYPQDPGDPPQMHPVIWPEARCGQYVGCHMSTGVGGTGGNHGYQF